MALPKLTDDLAIIQALSDLPNSEDGLTADELKAKFDEAALAIQTYLNNKLVPAVKAENIPFAETTAIQAGDIQAAIEIVQRQIVDAVAGTITPGSITKEKFAAELLARVYGGIAWVSADTPDGTFSTANDLPIGQVWLRPSFLVSNLTSVGGWTGTGCEVKTDGANVIVTGKAQAATATATQTIYNAGESGDRVKLLFTVEDKDTDIEAMTVSVNGGAETTITGKTVLDVILPSSGAVTVALSVTWPAASMADGSVTFARYTVVNLDTIMGQMDNAKEIADWDAYLWDKLPEGFVSYYSPEAVFIQEKNGFWDQISFDILPISRGGTGITSFPTGAYVKTTETGELSFLTPTKVVDDLAGLRFATGQYTGTGEARTMELSVAPKLLYLFSKAGSIFQSTSYFVCDNPVTLADGASKKEIWMETVDEGYRNKVQYVSLSGNTVTFSGTMGNRSGITYNWVAIY